MSVQTETVSNNLPILAQKSQWKKNVIAYYLFHFVLSVFSSFTGLVYPISSLQGKKHVLQITVL
jgi:hypothetical protein